MDIEGISLDEWKGLSREDQDILLAFGRPVTFHLGSANILAQFSRCGDELMVELAHIDSGGEGVLLVFWKAVEAYAADRGVTSIEWLAYALTCAEPNPRLQRFLRKRGFAEVDHKKHGPIFALTQTV